MLQALAPEVDSQASFKVAGEIFATTQGGDVKRGAGVRVYLIPLARESKELVAKAWGRWLALDDSLEQFRAALKHKYPQHDKLNTLEYIESPSRFPEAPAQAAAYGAEVDDYLEKHHRPRLHDIEEIRTQLLSSALSTTANSDGRFEFDVESGEYVFLSEQKTFAKEKLVWFEHVIVQGNDVSLSLDQDSALLGQSMAALSASLDSLDVQFYEILEIIQALVTSVDDGVV